MTQLTVWLPLFYIPTLHQSLVCMNCKSQCWGKQRKKNKYQENGFHYSSMSYFLNEIKDVRLEGFEPSITDPKSVVISVSPQALNKETIPEKLKKAMISDRIGGMELTIPKEVKQVVGALEKKKYQAYIVGGCVRDLLLKKEPKDWDIATNAKPEEIQKVFKNSFYENRFFTVTVRTESREPALKEIEITTYRSDSGYKDRRRPEEVHYAKTIEVDLSRRDFTVNALALKLEDSKKPAKTLPLRSSIVLVDPFEGQQDLKAKLLRAVGNPDERFKEDALRMMRAVRLAAVLGFTIEEKTKNAIQEDAKLLQQISKERVRDELVKIVDCDRAMEGIEALRELKLLQYIAPELQEGYGVSQNKHHKYTVWEHNLKSLQYAAHQKWSRNVRLAALFHDVAKPKVKRGQGQNATFYGHEVVGARVTAKILSGLKFPKKDIEQITRLIRYHMFYYNVDEVTEYAVRKLVKNVKPENVEDLLQLRQADRIGSGVPKAEPYKLRHLRYLIEKVAQDPLSPKMIQVNGQDVMDMLKISPGPRIGWILEILLGEILKDPSLNKKEYLQNRIQELGKNSDKELQKLANAAKKERESIEIRNDEMTKQKYWV